MKLQITCMQCFHEQGQPSDELTLVELHNDGLLSAVCSQGHSTFTALQEQKYEILFEIAVMALLDGYPREAATGMAAALERFYEFVIRVICTKRGINDSIFIDVWKSVTNQSERQLGAYIFAYLLESGNVPPTIDDTKPLNVGKQSWKVRTWKDFRNNVVHKGYMPSTDETIAYGELVFNHIKELHAWLEENCNDALDKVSFKNLILASKGANGKQVVTMSIPTLLSRTRQRPITQSLKDAIETLKSYNHMIK